MIYSAMRTGELMIRISKGDTVAQKELDKRTNQNQSTYQEWCTKNPGRSALSAFK